ncbi:flagellar biosynthetic protein FliO [bacterium]|nr:flagellar biosynthetic protein FliO [bacterium]
MKNFLYLVFTAALCFSMSASPAAGQDSTNLIRNRGFAKTIQTSGTLESTSTPRSAETRRMPIPGAMVGKRDNSASISQTPATAGAFPTLTPTAGSDDGSNLEQKPTSEASSPLITVSSSLAVVLGLFAALIWATRKFGARGGGNGNIPKEIFQNLGSTSIDPRTQVSLLRCGERILIIARTNNGVHSLGEITNKEEVNHLVATCTGDSTQEFQSALASLESEPTGSEYIGTQPAQTAARSRGRLFATA